MIYYIGIGLIMFGVGLFVGRAISSKQTVSDNGFLKKFKEKQEERKKEKSQIDAIKKEAKLEAMQQLKPEFIKQMKEQEIKKMTGQDKKEKLEKFAKMFSMGDGFNTNDKLNRMLGQQPLQQAPPQYQQPLQQAPPQYQQQRQRTYKQQPQQNRTTTTNPNSNISGTFSEDKINFMLGKKSDKEREKNKKDETQRIINFLK